MKFTITALLCLLSFIGNGQTIIHDDANDIKKINLSVFASLKPVFGAGPHIRFSYYPAVRWRLLTNSYYYFNAIKYGQAGNDIVSAGKPYQFINNELEIDYHLLDVKKAKNIHVALNWSSDGKTRELTYTDMPGTVRRILAFTLGVQQMRNNEHVYNFNRTQNGNKAKYYAVDAKSGKQIFFNQPGINGRIDHVASNVYVNTDFLNALISLKFKSISANGVNFKGYGKKFNDMHLETYATLILPIICNYQTELYRDNNLNTPSYMFIDKKVKPGFKFGIFHRNSIRNYWTIGAEFGFYPTIGQKYSVGGFFNLSAGLSLNFGKIKMLN